MAKCFLTAREIDEHADKGLKELEIDDNIVVTDIGQERARERGLRLVRVSKAALPESHLPHQTESHEEIQKKVRSAVIANLGGTPENLDAIIKNVLKKLG
jgi:hypothetical protein